MSGLVKVSYKNISGSAVPPWGLLQFTSACSVNSATGDIVVQATKPGSGTGPLFVDDGKGAAASGPQQFGSCFRATEGLVWAAYDPSATAPTAWNDIGSVGGNFYLSKGGSGFYYAGQYDSTNNRVLALWKPDVPWYWAMTTSGVTAASLGSPTTFTFNVWLPNVTGSPPYAFAVATDSSLLGLTGTNRSSGAVGSSKMIKVEYAWNEWSLKWNDC